MKGLCYELYRYGIEDIEEIMDQAKEILLDSLFAEGEISEECYEEFVYNSTFMIKKPSKFFGALKRLYKKIVGYNSDELKSPKIFLVKLDNHALEEFRREREAKKDTKEETRAHVIV